MGGPSHLHVEVGLAVEEVEEPLVVEELGVPLLGLVVAEVVAQRHQQDVASEEPGLLAILVQEQGRPAGGSGLQAPEQAPLSTPVGEALGLQMPTSQGGKPRPGARRSPGRASSLLPRDSLETH